MGVVVAKAVLVLYIYECHSLKEKRGVIKSIVHRVHHRFHVAVAEVDDQDLWQKATLGVAAVGASTVQVERQLHAVLAFIDGDPRVETSCVESQFV